MNFFKKKFVWAVLYGVILCSFTAYVLADTFLITRVYQKVEESAEVNLSTNIQTTEETTVDTTEEYEQTTQEKNIQEETREETTQIDATEKEEKNIVSENTNNNEIISADNAYVDENMSITLTQYREYDTDIYVADVQLKSADYLKTALAENAYGRNITEKTSNIAQENNAILAINGDYYGARSKGYVLRNGVLYRGSADSDQEDLVIWADGSFEIINEGEISASELSEKGAMQILSFGPGLVKNGAVAVDKNAEVGKAKASNPRTAIGIIDNLHYVFVVSDGRTNESEGLSLYELAEFMADLGVEIGYNLDGGGSSTMYFNGQVINNPTTSGKSVKERSVSDIVYIGY